MCGKRENFYRLEFGACASIHLYKYAYTCSCLYISIYIYDVLIIFSPKPFVAARNKFFFSDYIVLPEKNLLLK